MSNESIQPPIAAQKPHTLHGVNETRVDNYYWLRDDERKDPEVLAYLKAENRYSEATLAPVKALREELYKEMVARIPAEDASPPYQHHGYRYQARYQTGQEYALHYRQPVSGGEWQLLLDGNERAKGHEFYALGGLDVSRTNRRMAVAEDYLSRRQYKITIRDLESGAWLQEEIEGTSGSMAWSYDGESLFYVKEHPQTLLPYQIYRHRIGTPVSSDELIYQEEDERFYLSLGETSSEEYLLIELDSTTTSEVLLLDSRAANPKPQLFLARNSGHEYQLDHYRGHFYIRSNRDGKNFGLYQAENANAAWQTLIAPRDAVLFEEFLLLRDWLVVQERENGLTQLRQIRWSDGLTKSIAFDDPAYSSWLDVNPDPDTQELRYGYTSLTTPPTIYQIDLDSDARTTLKVDQVAGFDRDCYQSERLMIPARDGTQIPVSLVWRKDRRQSGGNPLLVYGYGAYGYSLDPSFSGSRLSLLDRGYVYAIAHIRGGEDLGRVWYESGRQLQKRNSFNDFEDVTRGLLQRGYGDPKQVFAMGGSAGGLLMGAVINQAPDLYKGVVAQVPFVDVLTTMEDPSIPLTTGEYDEWGNPSDPRYYDYIKSYSPIDQVKTQNYPNLLVTTGLHDSQVQYWEPAKWVAKLRATKTDDNLLLLYTDMDAGHGGKSGRFKAYEDIALEYAFILMVEQR